MNYTIGDRYDRETEFWELIQQSYKLFRISTSEMLMDVWRYIETQRDTDRWADDGGRQ